MAESVTGHSSPINLREAFLPMKPEVRLFKFVLAGLGLWLLVRLAFFFVKAIQESRTYSAYGHYDPTVFIIVGVLLLPPTLLVLRTIVRYVRKTFNRG
ncbi:MAG: hypothetical protein EOO60_02690 [Hymenobacter sp.]|nr:MAG: hypothetical protein EOO60_02690 [Hymenobacter sp.]